MKKRRTKDFFDEFNLFLTKNKFSEIILVSSLGQTTKSDSEINNLYFF